MKNGRALKGHKRMLVALGVRPASRKEPIPEGWDISCICGWVGGHWPKSDLANGAYRQHINTLLESGLFTCKRCGGQKPLQEMRPDYRYVCLDCFSKIGNEWQQKHPGESAKHKRNHHLLKQFGITLEEAELLLSRQGGTCAICHDPIYAAPGHYPHIDHDHVTGRVRGVLCFRCNVGLGSFQDDSALLMSAIEYLNRGTTR